MEVHWGGLCKELHIGREYVCLYLGCLYLLNLKLNELLSSHELLPLLYSFCGARLTRRITSFPLRPVSFTSTPSPMNDVCLSPDNEIPAVNQLYRDHDLAHLTSPLSFSVSGCRHMVCVPQLFHRRLSWTGTRDQGRAHSPRDFLQQPCTLQL